MRRGAAAWFVVLAACSAGDGYAADAGVDAVVDARTEGLVAVLGSAFSPMPGSLAPVEIRIDGHLVAAHQTWEVVFPDAAAFRAGSLAIELKVGDLVLDTATEPVFDARCLPGDALPDVVGVQWCAYANGEVRFSNRFYQSATGQCFADGLCLPACDPTSCPGKKCAPEAASVNPMYSRLRCVPVGAVPLGSACTWTQNAGGRYLDDCGAGASCVAGTCRAHCVAACGAVPCRNVAGFPPEVMVCAPP